MPELLNQPAKTIVVRDICCPNPIQNADVVFQGPFLDSFAANGKLSTALMPDVIRGLTGRNPQKVPQDLRKLINQILIVGIKGHRESLMHRAWTSRPVRTSQVHVAVGFHGLVTKIGEDIRSARPCDIIMPLLFPTVNEDCKRCEEVIVVDDIGKICACFVASS